MINIGVSDLWFNTDKTEALNPMINDIFDGYDEEKLQDLAENFIINLSMAGVDTSNLNSMILIEDFYNRV